MPDQVEPNSDVKSTDAAPAAGDKPNPQVNVENAEGEKRRGRAKPKTKSVQCRHCGERVSSRAKKCPACRTVLTASDKTPIQSADKETTEPRADVIAPTVQPALEVGLPSAPDVQSAPAQPELTACDSIAPIEGVASTFDAVHASAASPLAEAPAAIEAQELGAPPAGVSEPVRLEESPAAVPAEPLAEDFPVTADPPPVAVEEAAMASEMLTPSAPIVAETQSEAVLDEMRPSEMAVPSGPVPQELPVETTCVGGIASTEVARACEAIVPLSPKLSIAYLMSSAQAVLSADQPITLADPVKAQPQETPQPPTVDAEKKPGRLVRKRKLKVKQATAAAAMPASGGADASRAA